MGGYKVSDRDFMDSSQITVPQYKSLYPLAKNKGWSVDELKGVMQTAFGYFEGSDLKDVHLYELSKNEYKELRKVMDTK